MVRILIVLASIAVALVQTSKSAHAADFGDGHSATINLDIGYVDISGYPSWTEGSVGKLRHGDDGFVMNRMFIDYSGRLTDTLNAHVVLEAYDDDLGDAIDFTQAYVEWRPVPKSATRYRLKLGGFYPKISLENVDSAWSSPYTQNFSAINTWIAEEIRTFGAELSMSRRPVSLGGAHAFTLDVATFWGNDPAGSFLAWKGWSVHDRQTRFGDKLPLPPLPQIQPGMMFEGQDPYVEPFREIDNRAGFYVAGDWQYGKQFLLRGGYYDNRADPEAFDSGQYAWATKFSHAGLQATLPGEIGLIAQMMVGSTKMGPRVNGAHVVDTEFDSQFALLTRSFDRHRLSVRYDHFEVTQNDQTPEDNNPETGHAWTLGYQFGLSKKVSLAAEWLSIKTHRCALIYHDLPQTVTETQLQLLFKLRL